MRDVDIAYNKCIKVIESVINYNQLQAAERYLHYFCKSYEIKINDAMMIMLLSLITLKVTEMVDQEKYF